MPGTCGHLQRSWNLAVRKKSLRTRRQLAQGTPPFSQARPELPRDESRSREAPSQGTERRLLGRHTQKEELQTHSTQRHLVIGPKTPLGSEVFKDGTVVQVRKDVPEPSKMLNCVLRLLHTTARRASFRRLSLRKYFT